MLLSVLPAEGSLITLRIIRELQSALSFSEEEVSKFGMRRNGNTYEWDPESEEAAEIQIGQEASKLIREAFEKLDKSEKLTMAHLPLYERFILKEVP